ncbi:tRNA pseudouridine(38-40) synthase TruA [Microbacterium arabinogalactanolyticum]|uniref:tRNA pseudouridine(38-40) synthase TruA n=1 Tax=Microbacterium arabinogalactanolyticum TaxID=69365 RepID=UPI0025530E9F|nr:tRNA pseudouridine(38-40) synthase TruA [Microbacterium arabinogalactanolyticum]GLC85372.1 tRNA pseudouridine synthase A [Microbacterium arabinogalactanolyticum]
MRIRLDIAYDGTHFRGWAKQPGLRTVQGVLETALARIVGSDVQFVVAGRTDAGVHASDQVAHVDLDEAQWSRVTARHGQAASDPAGSLARRIRGVLGQYPDVTVTRTSLAPEGFDARFSAVWRRYRYRLADTTVGYDPMRRNDTTTIRAALDVDAMDAAARTLIGLHDFAAYCKPREEATTIRTLLDYRWARDAEGVLVADVKADAFCHSMVRALVGACAAVGEGKLSVDDVVRLRDELTRTSAFKVLPARGLTLAEVGYPADELLAARAEQTRARRDRDGDDAEEA